MGKPSFRIENRGEYCVVTFEIPGGICTPQEFSEALGDVRRRLSREKEKVVLLSGRGPVWGYGMLLHAAHRAKAIATFDPRFAGYVVVASRDGCYARGALIKEPPQAGARLSGASHREASAADSRAGYRGMVIAVAGPPHSGKSVFTAELYRQLLATWPSRVFLNRACPDGEGMWSSESDPALVAVVRKKEAFSGTFLSFVLKWIETLGRQFALVLVDLGGKMSSENAEIVSRATHVIILSSKDDDEAQWREFVTARRCSILAEFRSRLVKQGKGTLDRGARSWLDLTSQPVRGEFLNLHRGAPTRDYAEAIGDFAAWLIARSEAQLPPLPSRGEAGFDADASI